jgi:hypothetical protein
METKPNEDAVSDQAEGAPGETPPKKDPKNAAGSLNPKEKNAFYEAVLPRSSKRKRT